jgi:DNA (cytosine-5)-methyltransferase 1
MELVVDSFAGGGGASLGIAQALGRGPDVAINHDADAIAMHAANHPRTKHYTEDVWKLSPRKVTRGRPVGLLWSSPDCKHFSRAKGSKPVEKRIRSLAWVVIKWAVECRPRVIVLENVREFEEWGPLLPQWECRECAWKGTEGQALLGRHGKRRCPRCESRSLRQTDKQIPDPARKGLTFRRFCGRLRNLGYAVAWRVLNAADFGAPTHRRRLFLVARNDGLPIEWPAPTHGDPRRIDTAGDLFGATLRPWRTAAEIIDWSIPCPSIFERKRPLAEATLRRIALGIKRYVLDNQRPFLVTCNHGGPEFRGQDLGDPLCTLTASRDAHGLIRPFVVGVGGRSGQSPATDAGAPVGTITAKNDRAVVAPLLARIGQTGGNGKNCNSVSEPLTTVTSKAEHLLIAPSLLQIGFGEREGQSPRCLDLHAPLGTILSTGKHAVVAAFLAKHYGGMVGVPANSPLPTTTERGTQNQLVAANLIHLNHGDKQWNGADEPLRTVTTGNHAALVYSFLVKYFGTAIGCPVSEPLPTCTAKDRFGVVTVSIDGEPYVIADVGMRMLTPRELARGQGFPDDYALTGTNTSQVARIGNSVPPALARAVVEANFARDLAAAV